MPYDGLDVKYQGLVIIALGLQVNRYGLRQDVGRAALHRAIQDSHEISAPRQGHPGGGRARGRSLQSSRRHAQQCT